MPNLPRDPLPVLRIPDPPIVSVWTHATPADVAAEWVDEDGNPSQPVWSEVTTTVDATEWFCSTISSDLVEKVRPILDWAAKYNERVQKQDRARTLIAFTIVALMDTAIETWNTTHSQRKMLDAWKEALEPLCTAYAGIPQISEDQSRAMREYVHRMMEKVVHDRFVPTYWQRVKTPEL